VAAIGFSALVVLDVLSLGTLSAGPKLLGTVGLRAGQWRAFGNFGRTFRRGTLPLRRLVWEPRVGNAGFRLVSQQYWRGTGAGGRHLHHWLIARHHANRIPALRPFGNAQLNLLELPASLNLWIGSKLHREVFFSSTVFSLGARSFRAGGAIGKTIRNATE